jgi:Domain of unknown function (DUF4919)
MTLRQKARSLTRAVFTYFAVLALLQSARAENRSGVAVPGYHDKYSAFVRQLEAGQTNINYTEFRESFLESEQFKAAGKQKTDLSTLRKEMHEEMGKSNYTEIIGITNQMLSIDYTDMEAHKIRHQTYKILGDMPNSKKYHDIEFGLLNSIIKKGDGKTCRTAWPVIQVNEEYFILQMVGAKLRKQSIDTTGGTCDKMEVETDQGNKPYYFDISKVFKGYNKLGIH